MRMFVAVVPPEYVLEHLDEFLEPRREAGAFQWTLPEQLHVTLAFLGSVADRHLDDLGDALERAATRRTPFDARLTAGGAFPDAARARVLYAGLEMSEAGRTELELLAAGARAAASHTGIEVDGRRFRPHVTLARLGRPTEVTSWVRLLDTYAGPSWTVDQISLVESHLGEGPRRRPRYSTVAEFPLSSG